MGAPGQPHRAVSRSCRIQPTYRRKSIILRESLAQAIISNDTCQLLCGRWSTLRAMRRTWTPHPLEACSIKGCECPMCFLPVISHQPHPLNPSFRPFHPRFRPFTAKHLTSSLRCAMFSRVYGRYSPTPRHFLWADTQLLPLPFQLPYLPFSVHSSKFRIPQVFYLPLLRKHRGCGGILPILESARALSPGHVRVSAYPLFFLHPYLIISLLPFL
jgi:hypothetical protein